MISQNYKFISIFNRCTPILDNDKLYTLYNNTLYCTDLKTLICIPIISDKIINFNIFNNTLYYYNTDVYRYDFNTRMTKKLDYNRSSAIEEIIDFKTDLLLIYANGEIVLKNKVLYKNRIVSYFLRDTELYVTDGSNIYKIDLITYSSSVIYTGTDIIKVYFEEEEMFIFCKESIHYPGGIINIEIDSIKIIDGLFYVRTKENTTVYDKNINIITDNIKSDNIKYDDSFNIFYKDLTIIGCLEDVLDVKEIDDKLVYSTGNRLVVSQIPQSIDDKCTFASSGMIRNDHSDTILSISYNERYLITTSRDQSSCLYSIEDNYFLIKKYTTGIMNTCQIFDNMCVMGGDDGLLCLIKDLEEEEVIIQKVSDKDINSVSINKNLIFVASADKTCKIFDFNLQLVKCISDHKKSVMSVHASALYFCTGSSDKTIRVYNYNFECISVLSGHETGVLCVRLFNKDKKIVSCGVGGLIKIYDTKKGINTDNLLVNGDVWSINTDNDDILFGTTDQIVSYKIFKDVSTKNNQIHLKNRDFDKVVTNNNKLIYYMLKETNDRFRMFDKYKNKLYDIIKEVGRFKDIEFIMEIINYCIENRIYNKESIEILKKYLYMTNELYGDIIASEIYFK